ncbi:MAG: flap structure-specific endonuclease, partial [Candidatus Woesearchaeota archaeon]
MGVKIFELVPSKNIELSELSGKTIAIDAPMFLYQFLTSIRKPDGSPLTDSKGRITSHLVGLFSRAAKFVQLGIKTVFVFDGKPHSLKAAEIAKRAEAKAEAMLKFEFARAKGHIEEMAKFAPRTTRLSHEMIDEAKKLLNALGIPVVDGLSEGEAQASFMVKRQDAWAVASQDADCLVFGAPRLIRNLAASPHKGRDQPQIVLLKELLDTLGIDLPQLIALAMLVGTDYNPGGIKGIGPKKALQLVKKFGHDFVGLFDSVRWSDFFNF